MQSNSNSDAGGYGPSSPLSANVHAANAVSDAGAGGGEGGEFVASTQEGDREREELGGNLETVFAFNRGNSRSSYNGYAGAGEGAEESAYNNSNDDDNAHAHINGRRSHLQAAHAVDSLDAMVKNVQALRTAHQAKASTMPLWSPLSSLSSNAEHGNISNTHGIREHESIDPLPRGITGVSVSSVPSAHPTLSDRRASQASEAPSTFA